MPEFASDFDLSGGLQRRGGNGGCADHGRGAGEDFAAVCSEGDPGEAKGDAAEAKARADSGGEVDAEFGDGGVDEGGETEDEAEDAGERESAVAGEFDLEHHQDEGREEKSYGGVPVGEEIEAGESEKGGERSEGSGDYGSGDVELEIDEKTAEDEEEDGDVGIGEPAEEPLTQGGWRGGDGGVTEVEGFGGAVEAMDFAVVEGGEERGVIGGDDIDEF